MLTEDQNKASSVGVRCYIQRQIYISRNVDSRTHKYLDQWGSAHQKSGWKRGTNVFYSRETVQLMHHFPFLSNSWEGEAHQWYRRVSHLLYGYLSSRICLKTKCRFLVTPPSPPPKKYHKNQPTAKHFSRLKDPRPHYSRQEISRHGCSRIANDPLGPYMPQNYTMHQHHEGIALNFYQEDKALRKNVANNKRYSKPRAFLLFTQN